ncbi:hypothetical protein AVEN_200660-1 [Araneus ventricosus]|uniref:MADF domain-containing protein n=1 Tax=Araneus ventricosus TaxID=182803 RepID=A0A4Y2L6Z4_ARAVE|nr:hypothetical protein AVEN_200660-1 [Araneus ventricosus]
MAGNLKTVWNLEKESAFIDLVSERAALWNPVHRNYSKKTLRQALYEEIKNEIILRWPEDATLLTGGILHKKFNTLRSYFQREERKLQHASGSAGLELARRGNCSVLQISDSQQDTDDCGDDDVIPQPGTSFEHEPSTNKSCKTSKSIPARYYEGCSARKRRKLANTEKDVIKTVTSALCNVYH